MRGKSYAVKRFGPHRMGTKTQGKKFDHGKRSGRLHGRRGIRK